MLRFVAGGLSLFFVCWSKFARAQAASGAGGAAAEAPRGIVTKAVSPEGWLEGLAPASLRVVVGGLALWQWLGVVLGLLVGWGVASLVSKGVSRAIGGLVRKTPTSWDDAIVGSAQRPIRLILRVAFFQFACSQLDLPAAADGVIGHLVYTGYVIGIAWLLLACLDTGVTAYEGALADDTAEELETRALRTRLTVARSITSALMLLAAGAVLLMQFDAVRSVGLSLLASAGVGVAVVGFAAQKSLAGVIAGIQLSISQPVRIGDLIQYDGEIGTIEEINLTYVVIKLWDERRLVIPISKFIETPVQNWSRDHLQLTGTVFLHVDPTTPVPLLRAELQRLCAAHELWDGRTAVLAVTDMGVDTITLRALVSVGHPDHVFDLRNAVREGMVGFLQGLEGGKYLPRRRWELVGGETPPAGRRDGASGDGAAKAFNTPPGAGRSE